MQNIKKERMALEQNAPHTVGEQSIRLPVPVFLRNSASVVGTKEAQGPLGDLFDVKGGDDMFGAKTWEAAESAMQKKALQLAVKKAGLQMTDIRYVFAGDLLGQSIASSFGLEQFERPHFGLYGACSTSGLSLMLAAMVIGGGFADCAACVTSSHFASAEKEFRFPLAYGNQRPLSASWTVTGSAAFVLTGPGKIDVDGSEPCIHARAQITALTPGRIVDSGLKDSMNMGGCMAAAAADTIFHHLQDFDRKPQDYDRIITGDLGMVGRQALIDLLKQKGYDISQNHMDCGIEIFDGKTQDTHAGGSGCGCAAVVLSACILKQIEEKKWKRVLFVPTGALLSKTSFNEGQTVPGIAHGVVLEGVY